MDDDTTALERLEAASRELEAAARNVASRAPGVRAEAGARNRLALVTQRLKIALDELAAYDDAGEGVTDGNGAVGRATEPAVCPVQSQRKPACLAIIAREPSEEHPGGSLNWGG